MENGDKKSALDLLIVAATQLVSVPNRQTWDYGWSQTEYRRSQKAAIASPNGPVTLTSDGIEVLERAVKSLLNEQGVKERWQEPEVWEMASSLVAGAGTVEDPAGLIESSLALLRTAGPTLTVMLIANVTWNRGPLVLGDAVFGNAGAKFLQTIKEAARERPHVSESRAATWMDKEVVPRRSGDAVDAHPAIAAWSPGQADIAQRDTERKLQNVIDLTILLERDLRAHEVYRRGATNRPGIRGLTLDRGAIERGLVGNSRIELAASPLTVGEFASNRCSVRWFSAEPLPLGDLLNQNYLRVAVQACLHADPISARIRVAARWYTEAHYTLGRDDSALSLGVALDALLTGQGALPGSAMADRYALLSQDPTERRGLVKRYLDFYEVRSSVAHGGKTRKLDDDHFIRDYMSAVHWAAWRLIALREAFSPASEKEITEVFNDLRWGVKMWPNSTI